MEHSRDKAAFDAAVAAEQPAAAEEATDGSADEAAADVEEDADDITDGDEEPAVFAEARVDDDGDEMPGRFDDEAAPRRVNEIEDLERVDDDGDITVAEERELARAAEHEKLHHVAERDSWWRESFGSHTDSKPHGPMAVAVDVTFVDAQHVFGIPEHAHSFNLPSTRGADADESTDPFRLYNLDVFEYELDETMALYGAVPMLMAHTANRTSGVFWLNAAEMFVDIERAATQPSSTERAAAAVASVWRNVFGGGGSGAADAAENDGAHTRSHWIAETGVLDLFLLPGSTPDAVLQQYYSLTGLPMLPPLFSLGYHQCRWNYRSESYVI